MPPALLNAYLRTHYHVLFEPQDIILRIDQYDPGADRQLCRAGNLRENWSIVTPCNPYSRPCTKIDNLRRLQALRDELDARQLRWIASVNRDPAGEWPDEPGVLLCDPAVGIAQALGRKYRQNAIVEGRPGSAPRLILL